MNNTPVFTIQNPLAETIADAESIIAQLDEAATVLNASIADERTWLSRYRDALDNYEVAETEQLYEVVIMAQQKEGPLGGIPVSGKGYDIALTKLKNDLRKGDLRNLWNEAEAYRRNYGLSQADLEKAQTRFNALRKIADVKTQVLRASTI